MDASSFDPKGDVEDRRGELSSLDALLYRLGFGQKFGDYTSNDMDGTYNPDDIPFDPKVTSVLGDAAGNSALDLAYWKKKNEPLLTMNAPLKKLGE